MRPSFPVTIGGALPSSYVISPVYSSKVRWFNSCFYVGIFHFKAGFTDTYFHIKHYLCISFDFNRSRFASCNIRASSPRAVGLGLGCSQSGMATSWLPAYVESCERTVPVDKWKRTHSSVGRLRAQETRRPPDAIEERRTLKQSPLTVSVAQLNCPGTCCEVLQ